MANASNIFINIIKEWKKYSKDNNTPYRLSSTGASNWFETRVKELESELPQEEVLVAQGSGLRNEFNVSRVANKVTRGNMYLFEYLPAARTTLKYYDQFPLVLVIDTYRGGFIGLNLHYLPIKQRVFLMGKMDRLLNNKNYNLTTKFLRLNYEQLVPFTRYREAYPAIKRYRYRNTASRLLRILPPEWLLSLFLPISRFKKAKEQTVWNESLIKIRQAANEYD